MYQPVCKVATNSLIDYFASVMYDTEVKLKPFEIRRKIHDDFNYRAENGPGLPGGGAPEFIRLNIYKTYYKVAFVRDPWTRAVAAFRELLRRAPFGGSGRAELYGLTYNEIYNLMNGHISFDKFIEFIVNIEKDHSVMANGHWRPQVDCLYVKSGLQYDFIGKLENINNDVKHVQEHLGLELTNLAKFHVTPTYDYKLYYTNSKTIDLVGEYYKEDIEEFGYSHTVFT